MRKLCILAVLLSLLGSSVFAASSKIWANTACRTKSSTPDTNNHDNAKLTVRSDEPDFAQKSWIKFDQLGTVDLTGVRAATLTITCIEAEVAGVTLSVSAVNDDCHDNIGWTERTVGVPLTWNNAPGNDIASFSDLDLTKTTLLASLVFPSPLVIGQTVDIDVFSAIQADEDGIVQFVLHNSNDNINFATWDHVTAAYHPYLTLEYPPEGADYPIPADGNTVETSLSFLSWTNPEPNIPGTPITCDVYLGTEPNRLGDMDKKELGAGITTVAIDMTNFPNFGTLTNNVMYYWFVDCHDSSRRPNPVPGEEWSFYVNDNFPPDPNAGPDQITWGLFPKVITLDGTVTDDGLPTPPALTYLWEQTGGPASAVINSPDAVDTTVNITERGDYHFRLTANDGDKQASDIVQIVVGTNACDASHLDTGHDYNPGDENEDCLVDIADLKALIIDKWLNCTDKLDDCGN